MRQTREQLKGKLLKEAEAAIERLLDWHVATSAPDLAAIEDAVLKVRKQVSQGMAEAVLAEQEAKQPVEERCPTCGERMQYKGMRGLQVESRVGLLEIERGYYYCSGCRRGFFPPGRTDAAEWEALE